MLIFFSIGVNASYEESENFSTLDTFTLKSTPISSSLNLTKYNHTWLDFVDTNDYVIISTSTHANPKLDFHQFREQSNIQTPISFHQGLARSLTHMFLMNSNIIYKTDFDLNILDSSTYLPTGTNHNSEPDYYDGKFIIQ